MELGELQAMLCEARNELVATRAELRLQHEWDRHHEERLRGREEWQREQDELLREWKEQQLEWIRQYEERWDQQRQRVLQQLAERLDLDQP